MTRPLDEQFEAPKAERIRCIAQSFYSVQEVGGGIRYFAVEVARCLEAGLLLAALHVASSLLELSVRKLLIDHRFAEQDSLDDSSDLLDDLEYQVEDRKHLRFQAMVDELDSASIIEADEADALRIFYSDVRIPIQHGITRRFVRDEQRLQEESFFDAVFKLDHRMRFHRFEDTIEDKSLEYIRLVSDFVLTHWGSGK